MLNVKCQNFEIQKTSVARENETLKETISQYKLALEKNKQAYYELTSPKAITCFVIFIIALICAFKW